MDIGLLVLRALLAAVFFVHATQKLAGWFSGPGLVGATAIFDSLGQRPARPMVLLAGTAELAAAVMIGFGFGTPLGAAIAMGTMLVAGAAMTLVRGTIWNAAGGGEYPLFLAAVSAVPAFTGPGIWSCDAALDVPWAGSQPLLGVAAVALALLAAGAPLLMTRRALALTSTTRGEGVPTN